MKRVCKLILTASSALLLDSIMPISAIAHKIDQDLLCRKFPLNSQCPNHQVTATEANKPKIYQLDRQSFCDRFPLNSSCLQPAVEVIKLNLERSGDNDEWIRIEKQANKVRLIHTTRVKDRLTSAAFNGALGLIPVPLPFVKANQHNWEDHEVIQVSFKSDRCNTDSCIITAIDTLDLPPDTDIYAGLFTIDYQEKDLRRSVSLRIPTDAEFKAIQKITVEVY